VACIYRGAESAGPEYTRSENKGPKMEEHGYYAGNVVSVFT